MLNHQHKTVEKTVSKCKIDFLGDFFGVFFGGQSGENNSRDIHTNRGIRPVEALHVTGTVW